MNSVAVLVFALIAVSLAQDYPVQTNIYNTQKNFQPTELVSGVAVNGVLPALPIDRDAFEMQYYSLFVPESATLLTVSLQNTGNCTWVDFYMRASGLPCTYYKNIDNRVCSSGHYEFADKAEGKRTWRFYPGDFDNLYEWDPARTLYVGVSREVNEEFYLDCRYTLSLTLTNACGANQVPIFPYLNRTNDPVCAPYTDVQQTPFTGQISSSGNGSVNIYKVNVTGTNTNGSSIQVVASSPNLRIYAGTLLAPYSQLSDAEVLTYASADVANGLWTYELTVGALRKGALYVIVYSPSGMGYDNTTFNGTINIRAISNCAGMAGVGCKWPLTGAYELIFNANGSLPVYKVPAIPQQGYHYFYIDIVADFVPKSYYPFATFSVEVTSTNTSGFAIARKDGVPLYNAYESFYALARYSPQDSGVITFGIEDFALSGRYYIGIYCQNASATATTGCGDLTFSTNITSYITTGYLTTGILPATTASSTGSSSEPVVTTGASFATKNTPEFIIAMITLLFAFILS